MGDLLLIVALIAILLYAFFCYVNYRIVAKFLPGVTYGENLIPIYNWYLVLKAAVDRPVAYFWWAVGITVFFHLAGSLTNTSGPKELGGFIVGLMHVYAIASIAKKLGKSFWLYFILSLIPVVNFLAAMVLAFGDSKPVAPVAPPDIPA